MTSLVALVLAQSGTDAVVDDQTPAPFFLAIAILALLLVGGAYLWSKGQRDRNKSGTP